MTPTERAKQNHRNRQREGHKLPDWDGLSELMQAELILRETQNIETAKQDVTRSTLDHYKIV